MPDKRYLGDAVYISFDGYHVWLTTEYGLGPTNAIALEPPVLDGLYRYVKDIKKEMSDMGDKDKNQGKEVDPNA